ncbi:MAG TPA: peptidylprolyl isomerase [Devosiaceae bacterium]|nr:peptidylprolyl isomerase [Devosiaceae bacterium]
MNDRPPTADRRIGLLVLALVAVFAAVLLWQSPLMQPGTPEGAVPEAAAPPGAGAAVPDEAVASDERPHVLVQLADGTVDIELRPDLAPLHVERVLTLAREGFYDGIVFHRVIDGFMAQTGDPTGTGVGGSKLPDLPAEFSDAPFERGTVGMARTNQPNTANSQFFITYGPTPSLNGQYTVVGQVVSGMEFVDQIKRGDPAANGMVTDPDSIVSMQVAGENQEIQ